LYGKVKLQNVLAAMGMPLCLYHCWLGNFICYHNNSLIMVFVVLILVHCRGDKLLHRLVG